jgi:hypothetical protein
VKSIDQASPSEFLDEQVNERVQEEVLEGMRLATQPHQQATKRHKQLPGNENLPREHRKKKKRNK